MIFRIDVKCMCWMWICEWCCISVYFWSNLTYYVFLNLHSYDTRAKLEAWQLPGSCVDFSTSSFVDYIEHCKHRFVLFNLFLFCSRYFDIQICWKKWARIDHDFSFMEVERNSHLVDQFLIRAFVARGASRVIVCSRDSFLQ